MASLPPLPDSWFQQAAANNYGLDGTDIPAPIAPIRPNESLTTLPTLPSITSTAGLSDILGNNGGSTNGDIAPSSTPSVSAIVSAAGGGSLLGAIQSTESFFTASIARYVVIILGFIVIAAAVFSFKPVQQIGGEIVNGVRKGASAGAAIA